MPCDFAPEIHLWISVVVSISFQQINAAPYAERAAESDNESLKSIDCRIEKIHITPFSAICCFTIFFLLTVRMDIRFCTNWWSVILKSCVTSPHFFIKNPLNRRFLWFRMRHRYHLPLSSSVLREISLYQSCCAGRNPRDTCSSGALLCRTCWREKDGHREAVVCICRRRALTIHPRKPNLCRAFGKTVRAIPPFRGFRLYSLYQSSLFHGILWINRIFAIKD